MFCWTQSPTVVGPSKQFLGRRPLSKVPHQNFCVLQITIAPAPKSEGFTAPKPPYPARRVSDVAKTLPGLGVERLNTLCLRWVDRLQAKSFLCALAFF